MAPQSWQLLRLPARGYVVSEFKASCIWEQATSLGVIASTSQVALFWTKRGCRPRSGHVTLGEGVRYPNWQPEPSRGKAAFRRERLGWGLLQPHDLQAKSAHVAG